ncbi:phosphoadenosine phosphosulfate reductase [Scopulibacillus daqui]|uniref:Adenosine 5'-phosphosulfate reductase n=1 Tax=Scopulibacillus daqui TaxID=1469162 RepID=A0ABS2PX48_9BACL|nr:phosphoadenylyl-sulfate reductase [Scopulibacillus daqui]MBM7644612.1 phosphoadenosine phosphosulfate reductase [Scopulibacillus daqui]
MITYQNWITPDISFDSDSETKGALEVLEWAYSTYGDEILYSCSFGVEGSVLIDLISKVNPFAQVVFLDTGLHFQETYDVINSVKEAYPNLTIILKKPLLTLEEQEVQYGKALWKSSPNLCCQLRKIEPLQESLAHVTAWISGLRREQSPTRRHVQYINRDEKFKKVKICPLIHWTWKDVWRYVHKHQLPYHALHDRGYPSIGCHPCTQPAFDENDLRSGRWAGQAKLECGLHEDTRGTLS